MKKFCLLFKASFSNAYGSPAAKDSKERRRSAGKAALFVLLGIYLFVVMFVYFYSFSGLLLQTGRLDALIPLSVSLSSGMSLIVTVLHSHGYLYGCRDFELLSAMPLSPRTIFLSKFAFLYIECAVLSAVVALPCVACYGIFAAPPVWFYFLMALMLLTAPALGVAAGGIIAFVMSLATISAGAKNKLLLAFNLILVFGVMYLSLSFSSTMTDPDSLEAAADIIATAAYVHPLSGLMVRAAGGNILSLLLFTAANIAALGAITLVAGSRFTYINSRMGESRLSSDYAGGGQRASAPLAALYKRELSAYLSQYLYVINTAFGFILLIIASAALLVARPAALEYLGMIGEGAAMRLLPVVFTFLVSLTTTTSCSISIEGQSFWICRTLPVGAKTVFLSKQLVWWTVAAPAALIASAVCCAALGLPLVYGLLLAVYALLLILASGLYGLAFDLAKPKLGWTNPAAVIKQGMPVMYCMLISMAYTGAAAAVMLLAPLRTEIGLALICAPPAAASVILWRSLAQKGEEKLLAIES